MEGPTSGTRSTSVSFITLPWLSWKGTWAAVLLDVVTILLTLWDFVVEIQVRRELGDVYAGERVTHAIMGLMYGAILAKLIPILIPWWESPTALTIAFAPISGWMQTALTIMGLGVVASGLRDLYAALELPGGGWPWASSRSPEPRT